MTIADSTYEGEKAKRDSSTAQADNFAGAKLEEKASACFAPPEAGK